MRHANLHPAFRDTLNHWTRALNPVVHLAHLPGPGRPVCSACGQVAADDEITTDPRAVDCRACQLTLEPEAV